jgi:RNA polymerase sigma-70 factor (ECF subfamily)
VTPHIDAAISPFYGNHQRPMPVKPANPSMLGVTAAVQIDGLGLAPGEARRIDPQTDEAALVEAVRRNDAGSREALYHRYKRRVYALALRIVGVMDAEEVAQEAFIRIFRGLAKFRGDAALSTWIYRLAVNAALSHRARRGNNGAQVEVKELEGAGVASDATAAVGVEPVHGDAVLRARLERALSQLPAGYRTVIVLHDVEGLEHEEVASVLGCHVGTSKSQLHKARARLREILAADGITAAALENG